MKNIIAVITMVFSLSAAADKIEVDPGCIWNKDRAECVIINKTQNKLTCVVDTRGSTERGIVIGHRKSLIIEAGMYDTTKLFSSTEDTLKSVTASAICVDVKSTPTN